MTAAPKRSTDQLAASSDRKCGATLLAAGLVLAAALVAYHNSFHVPLLLDDDRAITHNTTIRQLWPPADVWSPPKDSGVSGRPVLNLTYALNYAVGGLQVEGYHAVNLAVHVLAALTLFGIVRRTLARWSALTPTRSAAPSADQRVGDNALHLAFFIALLWTVHPLQTESVVYLSERAEMLMALFYLLALYGFIRGAEAGEPRPDRTADEKAARRASFGWFGLAGLACFLGMATKESMVTAPVVIFIYDTIFIAGSFRSAWRARRSFYLGLAASWVLLAWLILLSRRSIGFHQGVSSWEYALTECQAVVRYLRLAFWPNPLVFDYGPVFAGAAGKILPEALVLLLLLAGTAAMLRRSRAGGFLGIWFFFILAPSSSVVPVALQPIAENRMYLPLAAVVTAFVLAAHRLLGARVRWLVLAIALGSMAATVHRNEDYRDELPIWSDTVMKRPDNPRAQNDLGDALAHAGRLPEAIQHYRQALQLAPRTGIAEIHYNLGKALYASGRRDEAIHEYAEVQALRAPPADAAAHTHLGLVDLQLGAVAEAEGQFVEALRLDPADAEAHFRLGNILAMNGRVAEAMAHWEEALRLRPSNAEAHNNLATALAQMGRIPEAIQHYREALRLQPGYARARNNLADLLARQKAGDDGK